MAPSNTVWLVVNAASGSNAPDAVDTLISALDAAGCGPARRICFPDEPLPSPAQLDAAGVGVLGIFTGDGTANAQVTGLYGWRGAVLVLPGGTQNLLARSLHGDADAATIVDRLRRGELSTTRRRMIRTSKGDALCEVLAGPGATWSDVREEMREGNIGGIATTLADALRQTTGGVAVTIAEPRLGRQEGYPAVRLYPGAQAMAVDGYGASDLADIARQGLAILLRDFRTGPHDELGEHARVTCRSEAPIELMMDGERATGGTAETFEIMDCDVNFLFSPGA